MDGKMDNPFDLHGLTAIVTGANSGIGQGIAVALGRAGAGIAAVGRSSMDETADLVAETGAPFLPIKAELGTMADIPRIIDEAVAWGGRADILVNNAGTIRRADSIDFTEEDWDAVMDLNLKSVFFLSQAFARHLLAESNPGKIINMASEFRRTRRRRAALPG
jgi:2-dehydro-3-deoxy-D-gluconate 5-dehydrogenase